MALLGGAWTPNVIWYLSGGPRRFSELRLDMPPISPKMLSARLKKLETKGVVRRAVVPTSPPSRVGRWSRACFTTSSSPTLASSCSSAPGPTRSCGGTTAPRAPRRTAP